MDIISGKDTRFTEAVALSFHGADVANFEQPFHKVQSQSSHPVSVSQAYEILTVLFSVIMAILVSSIVGTQCVQKLCS